LTKTKAWKKFCLTRNVEFSVQNYRKFKKITQKNCRSSTAG